MAKKITLDQLQGEIASILNDYNNSVTEGTKEAVRKTMKYGVDKVKSASRENFQRHSGKYASGWTSQVDTGRMSTQGTIYNQKVPGLPHLLENGHANRNGGRTAGRTHIAPVNDEIQRIFQEDIKKAIEG